MTGAKIWDRIIAGLIQAVFRASEPLTAGRSVQMATAQNE